MAAMMEEALLRVTRSAERVLCVLVRQQADWARWHLELFGGNVSLDNTEQ